MTSVQGVVASAAVAALALLLGHSPALAAGKEIVGTYGEWRAECERIGGTALCSITATAEDWQGDGVTLVYNPVSRFLSVAAPQDRLSVSARIDRAAPVGGDCLSTYCEFGRGGFGQALEQGTVLFVTLTGKNKKPLTFTKNLLDLRKAVAAARAWGEGKR